MTSKEALSKLKVSQPTPIGQETFENWSVRWNENHVYLQKLFALVKQEKRCSKVRDHAGNGWFSTAIKKLTC